MVESAHREGHLYLIHFFDRRIFVIHKVGMDDLILVVLLELPVSLFEPIEVVEEEEQVAKSLVTFDLFGGDDLALLEFFLLDVLNLTVNTENV